MRNVTMTNTHATDDGGACYFKGPATLDSVTIRNASAGAVRARLRAPAHLLRLAWRVLLRLSTL